jgi:flagellin
VSSSITINSNLSALSTQRLLAQNTKNLERNFERLSSGMRINKASDDAAGLAIAEALNADARVFAQGIRNLNDGISLNNTAEGALRELSNITTRQIELAEQAANGVSSLQQRKAMNAEANALNDEFNRIVSTSSFNGRNLLDVQTNGGSIQIQAGYGANGALAFSLGLELARTTGDGTFTGQTTLTTGAFSSFALTVGDVNGDGVQDLVTAGVTPSGSYDGFANIRLGNSNGTFGAVATYATETHHSKSVTLGDINNDGNLDLATAGFAGAPGSYEGYATIRLGNGNGTFAAARSYKNESTSSQVISLADMNRDGKLDMVTAGSDGGSGGYVTLRLGAGNGTFGAATSYHVSDGTAEGMAVGDVNGDNIPDILAAGYSVSGSRGYSMVLLGNGEGTFKAGVSYTTQEGEPTSAALSDLNGDGFLDLATSGISGSWPAWDGYATVRLGNGNGSFGQSAIYATENGGSEAQLLLGDINGDGISDLITAGRTDAYHGAITLRLGQGNGTFGTALSYDINTWSVYALGLVDTNGDQIPELITAGRREAPVEEVTIMQANTHTVSSVARLDLLSQSSALDALDTLRDQLSRVTSELSVVGSVQSRFSVAVNTLAVERENYIVARSQITDADIAGEAAELVKNKILQQAGAAVLAQANQEPALALKLLKPE